jgi:hypothetical protein
MVNKTMQVIEDEILSISQQLNEEVYEMYNTGRITFEQLEEAYRVLSMWSTQTEKVLKLLEYRQLIKY